MIKYLARWGKIETVKIVRETAQCVVIEICGRMLREKKKTATYRYFDSWDEAHEWLLGWAEEDLENARRALQFAQSRHGNIKGMKRP